jgi:hypothetical protein
MKSILVALALALTACTAPISKSVTLPSDSLLARDIVAAGFNLNSAVTVGALPANDPAVLCVNDVLKQSGLDGSLPAATSFVPKNIAAVSAGSIVYIQAQQLKQVGSLTVPVDCEALIGKLNIDGLRAINPARWVIGR